MFKRVSQKVCSFFHTYLLRSSLQLEDILFIYLETTFSRTILLIMIRISCLQLVFYLSFRRTNVF